jgi:hypothetical protein
MSKVVATKLMIYFMRKTKILTKGVNKLGLIFAKLRINLAWLGILKTSYDLK